MSIGKYVPIVATLIVAVVVLAGVGFPMIGGLSSETTTISNDGASWIRMNYITDQSDYSAQYTFGDNISVAGQSGDWEDMILYADSQCTICIVGDYLVKIIGDVAYTDDDPQTVTVSRSNGIVSIDGEPVSDSAVSWAYVPVANGKYSSFGTDTVPLHRNSQVAAVGGFAGVYAYNDMVSLDAGLIMDADVTEDYINSVRWALQSSIPVEETQPFHPIIPGGFDPGVLNPGVVSPDVIDDGSDTDAIIPDLDNPFSLGNAIMSVPTPTYTDGDWGYEYETVSGVQKAKIVSYSGAGGGAITIPATVGGYDVYSVGSGNTSETVFDTTITATNLIISSGIVKINKGAFKGCSGLTGTLTIPNTVTSIGSESFYGCSGFTGTLTIPASVTTMGTATFKECTGFTALALNEGLSRIENLTAGSPQWGCFTGCTGFTGTLTLPSTLTYIGIATFSGCTGFTSVVFNSVPTIPTVAQTQNGIFSGCTGLTGTITLPTGLVLGGYDFQGCTGITNIVLPSTTTTIPTGAFRSCTSITSLNIPSTVTSIGNNAFNGCSGITGELTLPASLTSIGQGAFSGCENITGVDLANVTTLNNQVFINCTGLKSVVLPASLTSIGSAVFKDCTSLSYVVVLTDAVPSGTGTNAAFYGSGVTQVLNLSSTEWTTTSYGLNAEEVRTDIEATSYMAPVSISETTTREGPTFDLLAILPIIFVAGLLMTTAWMFIRK